MTMPVCRLLSPMRRNANCIRVYEAAARIREQMPGILKEAASITLTCFDKNLDIYAEEIPVARKTELGSMADGGQPRVPASSAI